MGTTAETPFKILAVNVNSLIRIDRRNTLFKLLDTENPDLLLISETKLTQRHKLRNSKYNIIRRDRPNSTQGGGVAIFIRKELRYKTVYSGEVRRFQVLEACIVCIPLRSGKKMYVVALYAPEATQPSLFISELETLFRFLRLESEENYYLMAGDLNAKHRDWGNNTPNTRGNLLLNWWGQHNVEFKLDVKASDSPSFPRGGSYLDLMLFDARLQLTDTNRQTMNCLHTFVYDSDHCGLSAEITIPNEIAELGEFVQSHSYNYSRTRWTRFSRVLTRALSSNSLYPPSNRNLSNEEIDRYLKQLDETIKRTMDSTIPRYQHTDNVDMFRNATIDALHQQKSRLLSRLKTLYRQFTDRQNSEVRTLKSLIKNLQKLIKENYRLTVNAYWNGKISAVRANNPSMFPQINKIFRRNNFNDLPCLKIPRTTNYEQILRTAGIDPGRVVEDDDFFVVEDPQEKVEAIGATFQEVYKVNDSIHPNHDLENRVLVHNVYLRNDMQDWRSENTGFTVFNEGNMANNAIADDRVHPPFISKVDLQTIFFSLRSKKSVGIDGIPNIVLRHLPLEAVDIYTTLFNNALNNAHYPAHWKTAVVHPIPKRGKDTSNPANLRSISLLPNISKVFEKVIHRALNKWVEDSHIIPDNQFGFKAGHDTIHAASKLVSDIQWNKSKNQCTGACLIDLEKAFDTVWLEGLFYKLSRLGISKPLLYILYNMLTSRQFVVKNGNVTSAGIFQIKNGLQQGAVNSPILFNIYTSDLIGSLHHAIAYADDLIAYRSGPKIEVIAILLQRDFETIQRYCDDWKLKINFQKSETILFRTPLSGASRDTRKNWRKFSIVGPHGHPLVSKSVVRYLGIWLDQYLYFNKHIDAALARAKGAFALTKRLFYSSQLDARVKVICYTALIRPMLTYGCPVWFNVGPSLMEKIRVFERACLRACLRLYRTPESEYKKFYSNEVLYNQANLIRVDNFLVKLTRGHIARAMNSTNGLIFGAYYPNDMYHEKVRLNGFVPPEAFLYFDRQGLIQDRSGIPIIFHVARKTVDRRLNYERGVAQSSEDRLRFSRSVSGRDTKDVERQHQKFWWLFEREGAPSSIPPNPG